MWTSCRKFTNYGVKEKTYSLIGPVESYDIGICDYKGEYTFQNDVITYMKVKTMKIEGGEADGLN